jgi:hypothetical protein
MLCSLQCAALSLLGWRHPIALSCYCKGKRLTCQIIHTYRTEMQIFDLTSCPPTPRWAYQPSLCLMVHVNPKYLVFTSSFPIWVPFAKAYDAEQKWPSSSLPSLEGKLSVLHHWVPDFGFSDTLSGGGCPLYSFLLTVTLERVAFWHMAGLCPLRLPRCFLFKLLTWQAMYTHSCVGHRTYSETLTFTCWLTAPSWNPLGHGVIFFTSGQGLLRTAALHSWGILVGGFHWCFYLDVVHRITQNAKSSLFSERVREGLVDSCLTIGQNSTWRHLVLRFPLLELF